MRSETAERARHWNRTAFAAIVFVYGSSALADPVEPAAQPVRQSLGDARWTGPMLTGNADTLPQGHFYTEPYIFDVISNGRYRLGSISYLQYGLLPNLTVGLLPRFTEVKRDGRDTIALGDIQLLSTFRLTHFTVEKPIPSIALAGRITLPTGRYDRLGPSSEASGGGAWGVSIGANAQRYFWMPNGRLLRARFNVLNSMPMKARIRGRSAYGTDVGFRGTVKSGNTLDLLIGLEYSVSRDFNLALDLEHVHTASTRVKPDAQLSGSLASYRIPGSAAVSLAPGIEYNWSNRAGILVAMRLRPRGHNSPASVTPAIAFSHFW